MANATEAYTLTTAAYQDVSEGSTEVWFEVPFERNQDNTVRLVLADSLPSAATTNYILLKPARPSTAEDTVGSVPVSLANLTGHVYLRTDVATSLVVRVMRM